MSLAAFLLVCPQGMQSALSRWLSKPLRGKRYFGWDIRCLLYILRNHINADRIVHRSYRLSRSHRSIAARYQSSSDAVGARSRSAATRRFTRESSCRTLTRSSW